MAPLGASGLCSASSTSTSTRAASAAKRPAAAAAAPLVGRSARHHVSRQLACRGPSAAAAAAPAPCASLRRPRRAAVAAPPAAAATAAPPASAAAAAAAPAPEEELSREWYESGGLTVSARRDAAGDYHVLVEAAEPRRLVLHWAINDWQAPPPELRPPNTNPVDDKAVQTPFEDGGRCVRLHFPGAAAPERVVFVLKELEPKENWINNGSCYSVQLKPPGLEALTSRVVACEAESSHWSLKDRFVLANDVLDGMAAAGPDGMAFMFTWLRLSANRVLSWARNANYQPKDIAWNQAVIAKRMADKAGGHHDPWVRLYARLCLAGLPRGGGNGDDIRMGILHIMRDGGIKEGHRQGHDEPFLEQWHQKLHQNTTPDDVTICEAYLAFLHSGNHDDYWRVLWDRGGLTKERLEGMHNPIKAWPQHLPHLINGFKGYLWTLKTCHSGADMDTAAQMAKGHLDGDTQYMIGDLLANRDEWWAPGKILEIRRRMEHVWRVSSGAPRDVLLLDIALDSYFRTFIERQDRASMNRDQLVDVVGLVLDAAAIACESADLQACQRLWGRVSGGDRWNAEWGLQALAAAQRVEQSLAQYADDMVRQIQPHADEFGARCGIDAANILNFSEEVVRGQSVFVLSGLLTELDKHLREAAGAGAWQVVSQASAVGEVVARSLADMQGQSFEASPVIVLAASLGGMEDIPPGVAGVITESPTDVLSHVAIRARSQGVLLATCYDDGEWRRLLALEGKHVDLEVSPAGDVVATVVDPPTATASLSSVDSASSDGEDVAAVVAAAADDAAVPSAAAAAAADAPAAAAAPAAAPAKKAATKPKKKKKKLSLAPPAPWVGYAVSEDAFAPGVVGAKGLNLAALRGALPDWIQLPASVALPFGTFEAVLAHEANAPVAQRLIKLAGALATAQVGQGVPAGLAIARELVGGGFLVAPPELIEQVSAHAAAAGLPGAASWAEPGSATWPPVWAAITRVWASQWGDRAWLSRQACGVPEGELSMSVLLQEVVDAKYAFVLHTASPLTGARGELFGELVAGLGEVLVGNYPGRALGFSCPADGGAPTVLSLPSKRVGLYAPPGGTLIARSDTNGEDLEAFAGAGLYDSVSVVPLTEAVIDAAAEPLVFDPEMRANMIEAVAAVGAEVEAAFGGVPQDIEGVVGPAGEVVVVQARPQVLPEEQQ